jgi:S-adenosylmethionine:tRNA ribosyltransferase-isomerase
MLLCEFDYYLPKEQIAQTPLPERDQAKLMVLYPNGQRTHKGIQDLVDFFQPGDLLVVNNTEVLPAKLMGQKETGGKVEALLLPQEQRCQKQRCLAPGAWHPVPGTGSSIREVLIRGSKIRPGTKLIFRKQSNSNLLQGTVLEQKKGACFRVEFDAIQPIENFSILPLPPYIKTALNDPYRYQTVYAKEKGSLAAPTAGLHFTKNILKILEDKGIEILPLTLHIGLGTFSPIRTEHLKEWKMHAEYYKVSSESAKKINAALRNKKQRIFAVGTTVVRTLESVTQNGRVIDGEGWTDLFIYPGYSFQFPYAGLLTNFHLPKSSLILLAAAFAGKDRLFQAYEEAVQKKYRFYSLGDAMLILNNVF